jgi:hypothetical protein
LIAVASGIVGITSDALSEVRVCSLNEASLRQIVGGEACYGDAEHRCGDAAESGCDADCTRRPGTTTFHCYDGDSLGTSSGYGNYKTQPVYDHWTELANGAGFDDLTEKEKKPCNEFFCCGCDSERACSEDDEEENCVNEGGTTYGNPTTFWNQQPTGDPCEVDENG